MRGAFETVVDESRLCVPAVHYYVNVVVRGAFETVDESRRRDFGGVDRRSPRQEPAGLAGGRRGDGRALDDGARHASLQGSSRAAFTLSSLHPTELKAFKTCDIRSEKSKKKNSSAFLYIITFI